MRKDWNPEEEQYLKDNWLKMPVKKMAEKLGRSLLSVRMRKNVVLKLSKRGLVKTDFFHTPSADMYYILGLVFADGWLYVGINSSGNPYYSFAVGLREQVEIQQVLDKIAPGRKVYFCNKGKNGLWEFQLTNKDMYEDLVSYGLHPNKSMDMQFPSIPDKYLGDFVRGYFDGDGSICHVNSNDRWKVCFTSGSVAFLEGLRDRLHGHLGTSNFVTVQGFNMIYSKIQDVEKIGNLMYKSVPSLFLTRKQEKFMTALQWCWERK